VESRIVKNLRYEKAKTMAKKAQTRTSVRREIAQKFGGDCGRGPGLRERRRERKRERWRVTVDRRNNEQTGRIQGRTRWQQCAKEYAEVPGSDKIK
jgi:hypothetical protein